MNSSPVLQRRTVVIAALILVFTLLYSVSTSHAQVGTGPLFSDGIVFGFVRDTNGRPVPNASVYLFPVDSEGYEGVLTGYTNAAGSYSIQRVTYGDYHVQIDGQYELYARQFLGNSTLRAGSETITVTSSEPVRLDLVLQPAGKISGRVINQSDQPIQNVSATAYIFELGEWRTAGSSYNYDSAEFTLNGLSTGIYRVRVEVSYGSTGTIFFYPNAATIEEAADINVVTGETTAVEVTSDFDLNASISGTVTAAGTEWPLADIWVILYHLDHERGEWRSVDSTFTNERGFYAFSQLETDNYKIKFEQNRSDEYYAHEYNGNQPTLGAAPHIRVESDTSIENVDAALEIGGVVAGAVTSMHSPPVRSVSVTAYRDNGAGAWLRAGYGYGGYRSNTWRMTGLPEGSYRFKMRIDLGEGYDQLERWYGNTTDIEQSPIIRVEAEETQTLPTMQVGDEVIIAGTVRDTDWNRIANVNVSLYILVSNQWRAFDSMMTDSEGNYQFTGMPSGGYTLGVTDPGDTYFRSYLGEKLQLVDAIGFQLHSGTNRQGMNLYMTRAGSISGQVVMEDGTPATSGYITAQRTDGLRVYLNDGLERDGNGEYTLTGVPAGEYVVRFEASVLRNGDYHGGSEFYNDSATVEGATAVTVGNGERVTGIDAEIGNHNAHPTPVDASISGQVVNVNGAPLSGVEVHLYSLYNYRGITYWDGGVYKAVRTDANGQYRFDELWPNSYRVGFLDRSNTYARQYHDGTIEFDDATLIELEASEQRTLSAVTLRLNTMPR